MLTEKQAARPDDLFADERHLPVQVTWDGYQRMIAAYRVPDGSKGRAVMAELIDSLARGVPNGLSEVVTLGRTLNKRAVDVLA